jgi:isoleucyl-tRNA synthetase
LEPETERLGSNKQGNRDVQSQVSAHLLEIDRWILLKLNRLTEKIIKAYDDFEFHLIYHGLYDFCVNDLSAFYLDASKDRLYCGGKDSIERRSAQFAMHEILMTLVKLMAPILSFTAEDILRYVAGSGTSTSSVESSRVASVFLLDLPKVENKYLDEKLETKWKMILEVREKAYQKIEALRAAKEIGAAGDAQVAILARGKELAVLRSVETILPMVMIVSKVVLAEGESEIKVAHAPGQKCQRCWLWSESVGWDKGHSTLCDRCAKVVRTMEVKNDRSRYQR